MEWAAPLRAAGWQTHRNRYRHLGPPVVRAGVVQNLVERDAGKICKLHFNDGPHSVKSSADRRANHCIFANRRIENASRKFFRQSLGRFERPAESSADVLSVNEDALIIA